MQILYATQAQGETDFNKAQLELTRSIHQSRTLYFFLLRLILDLKILPNNRVVMQLEDQLEVENNYGEDQQLLRVIAQEIKKNPLYFDYIKADNNYDGDKTFLVKLFSKILPTIDTVFELIENQSIYHNDEAEFIFSMVMKTIKNIERDKPIEFLPLYDDPEDEKFVDKLLLRAFDLKQETTEYIEKNSANWDADRVAMIDTIIIQLIIAEIREFTEIDLKVTLNEWIEIAKYYSTERSYVYINGILTNIIE